MRTLPCKEPAGEERQVETQGGVITYRLVKKRVKNLNLRVDARGRVVLSIPLGCPKGRGDELVASQWRWIAAALARRRQPPPPMEEAPGREECRALLLRALEGVYPLVEGLGVAMPALKVRRMRSQWGNCHWSQGYVTLNAALARCPAPLREYVALHELVHFLHHDHGPGFRGCMDALMPGWRERRRELQKYGALLLQEGEREHT